jgi:hypothetical protein
MEGRIVGGVRWKTESERRGRKKEKKKVKKDEAGESTKSE